MKNGIKQLFRTPGKAMLYEEVQRSILERHRGSVGSTGQRNLSRGQILSLLRQRRIVKDFLITLPLFCHT